MRIASVFFGHPDAVHLNDRVQLEYAERYGHEGDVTPLEPTMFEPPHGRFLVVYDDQDLPVASGGWRAQDRDELGYADGDAEIKRMYVVPEARGRGLARLVLAALEDDARAEGRTTMVLVTGTQQPEAVSLYLSSGYKPCAKFGHYRFVDFSLCYAKPLDTASQPTLSRAEAVVHETAGP
ncbi:GNAT family N-acetyltransferase [Streptomyces sp. DSM 42041]|uniref:GNAT family N-acetyltransferase n=1 Tax=Streptomyces hazeniae TaxID=3075538 RepID=A0ABU2P1U7_9ACTN|nr:GNAT family N-acetyltransferase [Streptomyces sp. DSM 42041]MDT0382172.1 GNAT family N-acetyltransferase [Streptomyces sp. DSM 42041]